MSSKASKRNSATKVTNVIVTRKRAALQNRQFQAKSNKIVKSIVNKTKKKDITSPKTIKIDTVLKDIPLQSKVRTLVRFVEQEEYYPDKLKRHISNKKIKLKPKHNYKIIATSNKRKLAVPQKGGLNAPAKKHRTCSSSSNHHAEQAMVDMVQLVEDCHNLSDEDFMEILTCPSPVWWEDPPDDGYSEDAICARDIGTPQPANRIFDTNRAEEQNILDNNRTIIPKNKLDNITQIKNKTRTDSKKHHLKIKNKTCEQNIKFNEKKQKLENILDNIKNVNQNKDELKNICGKNSNSSTPAKNRRISNSTDGGLSDMSVNEEEILKNLESLDIPIEQSNKKDDKTNKINRKGSETTNNRNSKTIENLPIDNSSVPKTLPPLKRKPVMNNSIKNKASNLCSEHDLDYGSHSNFKFISNVDIGLVKNNTGTNTNKKNNNVDSFSQKCSIDDVDTFEMEDNEIKQKENKMYFGNNTDENNELCSKKKDLTEYITVYKIMTNDPQKKKATSKSAENTPNKLKNVRGKVNSFFKKCKSNKQFKKVNSFPASVTANFKDLNLGKENSDESSVGPSENRLKPCNYCVVQSENGVKNISCADCENVSIFSCDMCIFPSEKQVSSCKEAARISWKHNYIINET